MKRFLALILSILMLVSIISCGAGGTNGSAGSTLDSTGGSNTTDSGGDSSKPEQEIGEDRIKYTPRFNSNKTKIFFGSQTVTPPMFTNYYHGYQTAVSMTFDDGYDTNTGVVVSEIFAKYGFRGTEMITANNMNSQERIDEWNRIFELGYLDLGAHGYRHINPPDITDPDVLEEETKTAVEFLRENFPSQKVLTFATPYAHITDEYEDALRELVIGDRLQSDGMDVILGKEFNPYRVRAHSVDKGHGTATASRLIDSAVKDGTWIVELYHCVLDKASNSTDIDRGSFEAHCEELFKKYHDKIWFGSFQDVLVYSKQLEATTHEYTACDKGSMTFKVNCPLDKEIYNIPMTMKVFVPGTIDSAYALVNGEYQPLTIETDFSGLGKYVTVYDIPVDNSEVKIVLGGNRLCNNGCKHSYITVESVEATHDEFGYNKYSCTTCENEYYGKYTAKVHEYTGKREVIVANSVAIKGYDRVQCAYCDHTIIEETVFQIPGFDAEQ